VLPRPDVPSTLDVTYLPAFISSPNDLDLLHRLDRNGVGHADPAVTELTSPDPELSPVSAEYSVAALVPALCRESDPHIQHGRAGYFDGLESDVEPSLFGVTLGSDWLRQGSDASLTC
jgi:hypothetical protein